MRTVWLLVVAIIAVGAIGCSKPNTKVGGVTFKAGTKIGDVCVNPRDGAEMVWVPAGKFLMGSTDKQTAAAMKKWPKKLQAECKSRVDAQTPQHEVYLDGYWMYKHEVTVAQYRKFCEATKREMPEAPDWGWKDDHPMVMVTWQDAADYAKWAGVFLPTEAQWEKAARGTDGRTYPWGDKWPPPAASGNFADEALAKKHPDQARILAGLGAPPLSGYDDGYADTAPVGKFPAGASPYGCMDMAGNVEEWCADWYAPNYYKNAPTRNPTGPSRTVELIKAGGKTTPEIAHVIRGDAWAGDNGFFSCTGRNFAPPSSQGVIAGGFRCASISHTKG